MKSLKQFPLRRIAESVLTQYLGDLEPEVRDELAASLVRQWITNDGHAGFIYPTRRFWFQMVAAGDKVEVGFSEVADNWGLVLTRDWKVDEEEIPGLLHQLNLCQSVTCETTNGLVVRLRIEPKDRSVRCEEQVGDE